MKVRKTKIEGAEREDIITPGKRETEKIVPKVPKRTRRNGMCPRAKVEHVLDKGKGETDEGERTGMCGTLPDQRTTREQG